MFHTISQPKDPQIYTSSSNEPQLELAALEYNNPTKMCQLVGSRYSTCNGMKTKPYS